MQVKDERVTNAHKPFAILVVDVLKIGKAFNVSEVYALNCTNDANRLA
jgi:hypothetical protein